MRWPSLKMDNARQLHCGGVVNIRNTQKQQTWAHPKDNISLMIDDRTSHLIFDYLRVKQRRRDIKSQSSEYKQPKLLKLPQKWVSVLCNEGSSSRHSDTSLLVRVP